MRFITDILEKYFSEKQRQWIWFIGLWCFGLICAFTLGGLIRLMMGL